MSAPSWEDVKQHHPIGAEIEGVIENIQVYGVWVKYDFEFRGLMLIPDSGIQQGQMLAEVFAVGELIRARIIHHYDERKQLILSRRVVPNGLT